MRIMTSRERWNYWNAPAASRTAAPRKAPPTSRDPVNDPKGYLNDSPVDYPTMHDNTVSHIEGATPAQHFKGRVWYRGGHELFRDVGNILKGRDKGQNIDKAITTASAFSPQTAWGDNIQHAIHFLLHYDGDPAKRHDWQSAVIHPKAMARYQSKRGDKLPSNQRDLDLLANAHKGIPGFESLQTPEGRAEWQGNIRTRGADKVFARHNRQLKGQGYEDVVQRGPDGNPILDAKGKPIKMPKIDPATGQQLRNNAGRPQFEKQKKVYNPDTPMAHTGIPTLGGSIKKAKDVFHNVGGAVAELLGTRKTRAFYTNLRDESPMREPRTFAQAHQDVMDHNHDRPGFEEHHSPYFNEAHDPKMADQIMPDDEGYYEMPVNPKTGKKDASLHPNQRATIDTQHSRAITMPHGAWQKTDYDQPAALAHDDGYDVYERNVQDATKTLNDRQLDPGKHLLPMQVQAIMWGKHKDENEHFGNELGLTKQGDTPFQPPQVKRPGMTGQPGEPIPNYTQDWHNMPYQLDDDRKPAPDFQNAPNLAEPMGEDYKLPAMRERMMPALGPDPVPPKAPKVPRRKKTMMSRIAGTLRDHLQTGEPFDWHDHLDDWIARKWPHRAYSYYRQADQPTTMLGSRVDRELLAYVDEVLSV